jgi:signal transduction histidine kinase
MLAYSKDPSLLMAKKQEFELNNLLHKVMSLVKVPDNITLMLPAEKHIVRLSVIAFEQIMLNLLSNAIRYNDKEEGLVQMRFDEDEGHYLFEVEDNGIGIAETYHDKIFGSNFTLNKADRFDVKGSGIGLATVKDLVTALKGSIRLRSEPGKGSVFYISLKK